MLKRRLLASAAALLLVVAAIVTTIKVVLSLPGIPYNVSELFLDNASWLALVFFALGLVWIGAGAMLVASVVRASRRPYVVLPIALVIATLISKMLISRGATYESLDDILGTNNVFGLVTQQGIWGTWWKHAFTAVGVDVVDFIERRVRYCALYSIPLVTIVFALLPLAAHRPRRPHGALTWGLTAIVAMLWLGISGSIVLTYAATDNLTELIANPLYLLGVLVAMAANAALLLRSQRSVSRILVTLGASAAAIPISWWLLNAGFAQHVEKYSMVFSGTQFLLGPDRQHALVARTLFVRWALVYVSGVLLIWFGAWLAGNVSDGLAISRRSTVPGGSE